MSVLAQCLLSGTADGQHRVPALAARGRAASWRRQRRPQRRASSICACAASLCCAWSWKKKGPASLSGTSWCSCDARVGHSRQGSAGVTRRQEERPPGGAEAEQACLPGAAGPGAGTHHNLHRQRLVQASVRKDLQRCGVASARQLARCTTEARRGAGGSGGSGGGGGARPQSNAIAPSGVTSWWSGMGRKSEMSVKRCGKAREAAPPYSGLCTSVSSIVILLG